MSTNKKNMLKRIKKYVFNKERIWKTIVILSSIALLLSSFLPYMLS
ncbi:hypothetical protein GYA27_04130 [candidate division WWE3 bacterium]|uniref:Uncharacterized protein n=1 Tax=candidate division WWE3 bacterium TaxID=2053526 RepID=A0A7X9DLE2_UNCKA|nr:hypothetical protein [candidate division WWE3 bacterium]